MPSPETLRSPLPEEEKGEIPGGEAEDPDALLSRLEALAETAQTAEEYREMRALLSRLEQWYGDFSPERDLTLKDREGMKATQEAYRQEGSWHAFSVIAVRRTLLGEKIDLTLKDREGMRKKQEVFRQKGNWHAFSGIAARRALLGEKIDLTTEERVGMKATQEVFRQEGSWHSFSEIAVRRTLLSARTIEIPPGGGLILDGRRVGA